MKVQETPGIKKMLDELMVRMREAVKENLFDGISSRLSIDLSPVESEPYTLSLFIVSCSGCQSDIAKRLDVGCCETGPAHITRHLDN